MALYQARVSTEQSPERAFAYLSDFRTVAEWDPGVVRSERIDEGPLRVGSLFDVTVRVLGRELTLRYEVIELDPARRIVLEAEGSGLRSYDVIRVLPDGGGARVEYDAELTLGGPLRALDPALQLAFDRIGRDAAQGMARALGGHWREEREGRTLVPCLWVSREVEAPASEAWDLLSRPARWSEWSPSISDVECEDEQLASGTSGRVKPVAGPWLPFEVDALRPGCEWSWRVAGLPATRHRVNPLGADRCRVELGVPLPAAPYLAVCSTALARLAQRAEARESAGAAPRRATAT